jgi:hypothetical protein
MNAIVYFLSIAALICMRIPTAGGLFGELWCASHEEDCHADPWGYCEPENAEERRRASGRRRRI